MKLISTFTCLFILTASAPVWATQLQDGVDCVMCEGALPNISNEPLVISPEDMVQICAYYSTYASLDRGHAWSLMKYGNMERFYAAYDQIECDPGGVLPLEIIIVSNYQHQGIRRDLEGLAALPESQRLRTINRTYRVAGRGQTIIDRINRVIRGMEPKEHMTEQLNRMKSYRQALIDMGAKAFRDL